MIAIVSDSHVPTRADKIPKQFREKMKEADLIVHAGDFAEKPVYNGIDEYGELIAVKGNCDFFDLPNSQTFTREDIEFGVYHGTGINPRGDHETLKKIALEDLEVQVLIHGHTHQEEIAQLENVVLLNPGSCTGVGGGSSQKGKPTMIQLETTKATVKVKMLEIQDEELKIRKTKTLHIQ